MFDLERKYSGNGRRHENPISVPEELKLKWVEPEKEEPYQADKHLVGAVNLALFLKRPLLIEGDPGCGKTRLAYAVANELGYPLFTCYVRSTTRAGDLLYKYDRLEHLYDIELARAEKEEGSKGNKRKKLKKTDYRKFMPLGEAILLAREKIPSVVLIDEVDKADIDFPNDLLQVLDEWRFRIDETDEMIDAAAFEKDVSHLPLVIITSNREKELPAPFLRRCLYFDIRFPEEDAMEEIVKTHFEKGLTPLFKSAVQKFMYLRNHNEINWKKKPATSELILWIKALEQKEQKGEITPESLDDYAPAELPFLEVLVKNRDDRISLKKV